MSGGTPWTAGPWVAHDTRYNRDFRTCLNVMTQDGLKFVAAVSCDPHTDTAQLVANARLIAAAPEMADGLKRAVKWLTVCDDPRSDEDLRFVEALLTKIGASQ